MDFLWFILIGAAAGWLAGQLIRGSGFGVIGDIIIGVLGAMLGGWLFRQLGISISSNLFPRLFTALVGAVILLVIVGYATTKKKK